MAKNGMSIEKAELTSGAESVLESLRTRDIPRLEAMLAEQKASGALKKDIAETQKWLNSANRSCRRLQKTIQELER